MLKLPARYEPVSRLGQGGGGEVWAVHDRARDVSCAFKVLAASAGDAELEALVREATALSGLEGLGVPAVLAFGTLPDGRRYLVRELVQGRSLDEVLEASQLEGGDPRDWLEPLAHAAEQLTALHRAGLLHGDVKPANVIVGPDRRGTLVDLGLATPFREKGARARGLTPKYAAPELLSGAPLTVRAEVYALGATLAEGLARRSEELDDETRLALAKVAMRAKEEDPAQRYPSTSELGSALRQAAGLEEKTPEHAWPVLGVDAVADALAQAARALARGHAVVVMGQPGSGRTTLLRRLAWSLGIEGRKVVLSEAPEGKLSRAEVLALDLEDDGKDYVVVVDDADELDAASVARLTAAATSGACLVLAGGEAVAQKLGAKIAETITVPPLPADAAELLLRRAMPSLPEPLAAHLIARAEGRPGRLRDAVRALAGVAVVTTADVDAALDGKKPASAPEDPLTAAERALATGRMNDAKAAIASAKPKNDSERVRLAVARARRSTARGDAPDALAELERVAKIAGSGATRRLYETALSRAHLRAGRYADAEKAARSALERALGDRDATTLEAQTTLGLCVALGGDDAAGMKILGEAAALADELSDVRARGVALCSAAIAHQRAGRMDEARRAYEDALTAATSANDAGTVSATRMNLAALARSEGDLASAMRHLEAVVDLSTRAGGLLAVQQARLNLVNLDLYLGRLARAKEHLEALQHGEPLGPAAHAQLLGCFAELAARSGDVQGATASYARCADAWAAEGRPLDAAEARLESVVVRARQPDADVAALRKALANAHAGVEGGFGEHETLASLARGLLATRAGDEAAAREALDDAVVRATAAGAQERAIWALEARARFFAAQGNGQLSKRDSEAALGMLEETATKLPRDLREVFWDDPRRRAVRQRATETQDSPQRSVHDASLMLPRPAEDKLARILEITRELATEHDLARLLNKVTDHAVALLGGERGFVVLVNDAGELETQTARDRRGDDPHALFSHSVAERVVQTGEPVVATKAREDERLLQAVSVHQLMIQSIACVPVRGAPPLGRPIGALYVETHMRPGLRFQEELPTLSAFADQAAVAIENARLHEENRKRADELERTNEELAAAKDRLSEILGRRTEQLHATRRDLHKVRAELRSHFGYAGLVGTSAAMRKLYALIDRVKETDVPVLVTGESGTGKEVVARAVHDSSARAKAPFLGVNCGAIPANLLESELFGHVRGAFTGADRERKGLFREAEGGTILLDEIGEMPLKMQSGLLRVLQEKTVRPVGGAKEEAVNARVIAATNRDLESMVAEGTFREDLFYRLHVVDLRVPPLRERTEDIPPLIDHFLTIFANRYRRDKKSVERDALRRLAAYDWPGNVRQLEHVLLNAWLMGEGNELCLDDFALPDASRPSPSSHRSRAVKNRAEYKDSEKDRILRALAAANWNRVKAAQLVGMPRRTFYRRLKEFGIL